MLSSSIVAEIKRLLAGGELSNRAIAARLGIGRSTVNAIASGKRQLTRQREPDAIQQSFRPKTLPERCPYCGTFVYLPCLVCEARLYQRAQKRGSAALPRRSARRLKRA